MVKKKQEVKKGFIKQLQYDHVSALPERGDSNIDCIIK